MTRFDSIEDCITAFANGEFLVVLDADDRENEGDLIIAAQDLTTEKMAFMVRYTRYPTTPPQPRRKEASAARERSEGAEGIRIQANMKLPAA
jgi:3,4-dihydroxy-2-butanone 4-phosphate synthase